MTDSNQPKHDELREAWIESMLVSATRTADHEARVQRAMSKLDVDPSAQLRPRASRRYARTVRWASIGTAAAILIAVVLIVQESGATRSAEAALLRSMDVAAETKTRKYAMEVTYRSARGTERRSKNDLYVRGNDQFAIRHRGLLPGTSFWLGKNGTEEWVAPALGPIIRGEEMVLQRWLRSHHELDTPYLHIATILARMSDGYRLKSLVDESLTLPDGSSEVCQHIRAERIGANASDLPLSIDLWASRETGMAMKLIANWHLDAGVSGRESVELRFASEQPDLADEWFTPEQHWSTSRRRLRTNITDQSTQ